MKISKKQFQILLLIAKGYLYKDISDILNISLKAVYSRATRLHNKLNTKNRSEIVNVALSEGLISTRDLQKEAKIPSFSNGKWKVNEHLDITCESKYIALVCHSQSEVFSKQAIANAKLIASAPELYNIVHSLTECKVREFLDLRSRANKLLNKLALE